MWDVIVPLILMLIFYLVPELLKKKRRQEEYKYPEIPDTVPPPLPDRVPPPAPARMPVPDIVLPPADEERPRPVAVAHRPPEPHLKPPEPHFKPPEPHYVPKEEPAVVAAAVADPRPWDGKLDQAAVVNGIIFAEIIQPPRCKRPFRHGFGR